MKWIFLASIPVLGAGMACGTALSQQPGAKPSPYGAPPVSAPSDSSHATAELNPVPLEWTPPALADLSAQAPVKTSFTLDRTMLAAAAALMPDSEVDTRQAINKLDGVSVHMLRFGDAGIPDEEAVDAIRAAYHLRGWKHLVTTTRAGGPVHDGTTDVWVVMDGVNLRGAVVLAETPKSLTLVTVAGNLNPVDLLHLGGHFGIPNFDGESMRNERGR